MSRSIAASLLDPYRTDALRTSLDPVRSGFDPLRATLPPRPQTARPASSSTFLYYKPTGDPREEAMNQRWLQERAAEADAKRVKDALKRAMTTYSINRARVEAEIVLRRESLRLSSKLNEMRRADKGVTLAAHDSYLESEDEDEEDEKESADEDADKESEESGAAEEESDEDGDDAGDDEDGGGGGGGEDGEDDEGGGDEDSEDEDGMPPPPPPPPPREEHGPLARIPMKGKIWLSPFVNVNYQGQSRLISREPERAASALSATRASICVVHAEPAPPTIGKDGQLIPPPPPLPPRPVSATNKQAPVGKGSMPGPSLSRVETLSHIAKIKETFSRRKQHVSAASLEKGLGVPDDRSIDECKSLLPRPGSRLIDPAAPKTEKKGKKGKAGKKGKKGKKKK